MIAVLQWVALTLCLMCAAWRLPAAFKGRNAGLFWAFLLLSVAVGLSLPSIYLRADALLGGRNLANLAVRFALYAIFYILAAKLAGAYRAAHGQRLIRGPVGVSVLVLIAAGTLVLFLLSDLPVSSTGLAAYSDQPTVRAYALAGRLYPAYAAACLLRPSAHAALTAGRRIERVAAALICSSFAMVLALTALQVASLPVFLLIDLFAYGAIVCMAVGLALVWISLWSTGNGSACRPLARE
ncbi:hypothetical protein [Paenarthrobacter sp. PH39-S1]|uniref:hypothetical protein n=1 Tax=Paenarthrobacter sp. PH39-S1 TaxID=3046204 RepID=UPI0024BB05E2|nr:hypothetical protein [Paenarthrobacter sp. PH39-S1]MDJ0358091.1 hypothetical protein [Paenarthrobacter sp. PH39-S1]